jgi:hypothetical protein
MKYIDKQAQSPNYSYSSPSAFFFQRTRNKILSYHSRFLMNMKALGNSEVRRLAVRLNAQNCVKVTAVRTLRRRLSWAAGKH